MFMECREQTAEVDLDMLALQLHFEPAAFSCPFLFCTQTIQLAMGCRSIYQENTSSLHDTCAAKLRWCLPCISASCWRSILEGGSLRWIRDVLRFKLYHTRGTACRFLQNVFCCLAFLHPYCYTSCWQISIWEACLAVNLWSSTVLKPSTPSGISTVVFDGKPNW